MMIRSMALIALLNPQGPAPQEPVQQVPVVVPAGERLEVNVNPRGGTIRIETWDRDSVSVTAQRPDGARLEVKPGATVEVQEFRDPRTAFEKSDYRIRVPAKTAVTVVSDEAHVEVHGVQSGVSVNVNRGSVEAHGVAGSIVFEANAATFLVDGCTGDAALDTERGEITVRRLQGDLVAENVRGDVVLEEVRGDSVRVTSNSGAIRFAGPVATGGLVDLASQSGAIELSLPATSSAVFKVGTVRGTFTSDFDLGGTQPAAGKPVTFTVGSGSARVTAISYTGDIRVSRAR